MDNDLTSTNNFIEETFLETEKEQRNKENLQYKNKTRKETQEKFLSIEKILQENICIEKDIKKILDESKFNIYSIRTPKYLYFSFIAATLIIASIVIWKLHIITLNSKLSFILIPLIFILVNIIGCYTVNSIWKKRIYRKHIDCCKDITFENKNLINLICELIDNQVTISELIPNSFFKYFIKRHHKISLDKYIRFLCKHSKALRRKSKNKNLSLYQGIFSQNSELLDKVKTIKAQYFSSMFRSPVADTIEECVEKFLRDEASIGL